MTSLWEVSELVGGYAGSTLGGFAANSWGFATATHCVVAMEATVLMIVSLVQIVGWRRRRRGMGGRRETDLANVNNVSIN